MTKLIIVAVVVMLLLVFAAVAGAVSDSVIDAIIDDAQDGTVDDGWSAAEVDAALDAIRNDPLYQQYSDLEGVLEDFLASLQAPDEAAGGELAFTGGELLLLIGAGAGLIGSGALLRRRRG
jgi:hypothetical protein